MHKIEGRKAEGLKRLIGKKKTRAIGIEKDKSRIKL